MCVFALLGLILPYALAVILLAIPVLFFLSEKYTQNLRFRSAILIVVTLLLTVGLGWAAILPVTQGVTGSLQAKRQAGYESRTHRKSLSVMLRGFFVYIQQVKTNPLKYRILYL